MKAKTTELTNIENPFVLKRIKKPQDVVGQVPEKLEKKIFHQGIYVEK